MGFLKVFNDLNEIREEIISNQRYRKLTDDVVSFNFLFDPALIILILGIVLQLIHFFTDFGVVFFWVFIVISLIMLLLIFLGFEITIKDIIGTVKFVLNLFFRGGK